MTLSTEISVHRHTFHEVKQPKDNPDQTHGFEVIYSTTTPKIVVPKYNDLEPPNSFLAYCLKLMRSYETPIVSLK